MAMRMGGSMNDNGLVKAIESLLGGAATTLIGAAMGRLMYHFGEVRKQRRPIFGWEILWEMPMIIGMGIIGEGLASYLGFEQPISTAIVATLSFYGPRGVEVAVDKILRGSR